MSLSYYPRISRDEQTDKAYSINCKKELAGQLIAWLNRNGITAKASGAESSEDMGKITDAPRPYAVTSIEIKPPHDYAELRAVVDQWLAQMK